MGPELSRLTQEFEQSTQSTDERHHKQYAKFQCTFKSDVQAMVETFVELGNPFLEDSGQLIELDGSIIMPDEVSGTVYILTGTTTSTDNDITNNMQNCNAYITR